MIILVTDEKNDVTIQLVNDWYCISYDISSYALEIQLMDTERYKSGIIVNGRKRFPKNWILS